eukprot:5523864-Pyramimonas_sp.AAC.1
MPLLAAPRSRSVKRSWPTAGPGRGSVWGSVWRVSVASAELTALLLGTIEPAHVSTLSSWTRRVINVP